jgi:hypothetical protein
VSPDRKRDEHSKRASLCRTSLGVRIGANTTKQLDDLATRLFKRVNGKSFKKTDFALALLMRDPETWTVPTYISQGLKWLENVVKPEAVPPVATTEDGQ